VLKVGATFTLRKEDGEVAGLRWWMPRLVATIANNMLTMDEPDHTRLRASATSSRGSRRLARWKRCSCDGRNSVWPSIPRKSDGAGVPAFVPLPSFLSRQTPAEDMPLLRKWCLIVPSHTRTEPAVRKIARNGVRPALLLSRTWDTRGGTWIRAQETTTLSGGLNHDQQDATCSTGQSESERNWRHQADVA
jgi:hypothetical protein